MTLRAIAAVLLAVVSGMVPSRVDASVPSPAGQVRVVGLTAEHQVDPLGIDAAVPRLGWVLSSRAHGISQSAYEIAVARAGQRPAAVWDSGKVSSPRSFDVDYAGPQLQSRTRYVWRVRVWDAAGAVSRWSDLAWFETAFLAPSQFQGAWIGSHTTPVPPSFTGANWIWYPEAIRRARRRPRPAISGGRSICRRVTRSLPRPSW